MELRWLSKFSYTKINRKVFSSCSYVIVKWLEGTDIKTDHKRIAWVIVDWICLTQDRENLQAVGSTVHKMQWFSWLTEDEQLASTGRRVVELYS